MSGIEAVLRRLLGDLSACGARLALVGGLAVSVRTEPRFTRDVDLAVATADDAEAESIVAALRAAGYVVVAATEQEAAGRLATVRLQPPGESSTGVVGDLLFASSGIEPEIVEAAEPLEIAADLVVPVARSGHLLALKLLSAEAETRPLDLADLRGLRAAADGGEIELARQAIGLIERRGFGRGRDLTGALDELLR